MKLTLTRAWTVALLSTLVSCESREDFANGTRLVYRIGLEDVPGEPRRLETEVKRCVEERLRRYGQPKFRTRIDRSGEDPRLVIEVPPDARTADLRPLVSRRGDLTLRLVAPGSPATSLENLDEAERAYLEARRTWIARHREWSARRAKDPALAQPEPTSPPAPTRVTRTDTRTKSKLILHNEPQHYLDGRHVSRAAPTFDATGQPAISFELDAEGATRFGELTASNQGRQLAIVVDEAVLQTATIQSRIGSRVIITGNFTSRETASLGAILNAGALPAELTLVDEQSFRIEER